MYSYNKSYTKSLVVLDTLTKNIFISYFNKLVSKIKVFFKRRRTNKIRYSANKIFVSDPEFKHNNSNLIIIIRIYNKQKLSIEKNIRKIMVLTTIKKHLVGKRKKILKIYKKRFITALKKSYFLLKE